MHFEAETEAVKLLLQAPFQQPSASWWTTDFQSDWDLESFLATPASSNMTENALQATGSSWLLCEQGLNLAWRLPVKCHPDFFLSKLTLQKSDAAVLEVHTSPKSHSDNIPCWPSGFGAQNAVLTLTGGRTCPTPWSQVGAWLLAWVERRWDYGPKRSHKQDLVVETGETGETRSSDHTTLFQSVTVHFSLMTLAKEMRAAIIFSVKRGLFYVLYECADRLFFMWRLTVSLDTS